MQTAQARDAVGSLVVSEPAAGVLEVVARGRLSAEVGAVFPRFARQASLRAQRCVVFLDVRDLQSFEGAVRSAWLATVLEHKAHIDEVVVLSRGLAVTLSARAAALALAPFGVHFVVVTDETQYARRRSRVAPSAATCA